MALPISLQAVVDEIDVLSDEHFAYLNPQTGALITLNSEEISIVERAAPIDDYPEWQQALLAMARTVLTSNEYLSLPNKRDIHEYAIMERFCLAVADVCKREQLLDDIRGSGAFRRFKHRIERYGLVDAWHQFRAVALETIAIEWLEAHHIPYHRDTRRAQRSR
jgi:hypothetical protein